MVQKTKRCCPYCKGEDIVKRGIFETKAHGKQQRYFCKHCNKKFIKRTAFYRMRNNEKKITAGIDLYYKGVSLRKVQEHFQAFYPHNSSHMSVYRWIVKYSVMVSNLVDNLPIQSGQEIMSDEMEYYRRISKYQRGKEQNWFVDTFDPLTRYMITGEYMKSRTNENLIKIMKRTRFKTNGQVKIITTDGLRGYPKVLRKTFGLQSLYHASSRTKSEIIHNVIIADERGFNHPIERLHNTIRERTKTMRGFHGSLESAYAIMKGLEINYNFNRKNLALKNKTPAEITIPEIAKLLGRNKWQDLIKLSVK